MIRRFRPRPPMPHGPALVLLAILFIAISMTPVAGQDPAPGSDLVVAEVDRDKNTGVVTVEAVAPVELAGSDIPKDAVTVVVDDVLQDFDYVSLPSDNLRVVLVLDSSGSMRGDAIDAAKDAASSFIRLLPPQVEVGAIAFSSSAEVIAPLGASSSDVLAAVDALTVGGETALFDSLILAGDAFGPAVSGERRVVVVLTDGADSASAAGLDDARAAMKRTGVTLESVALQTGETAAETLELLTAGTTGRVNRVESADALQPLYTELAAELASRFRVSFSPPVTSAGRALIVVNHEGALASSFTEFGAATATTAPTPPTATTVAPSRSTDAAPSEPESFVGTITGWAETRTARNAGVAMIAVVLLIVGLLLSFPTAAVSQLAGAGRDRVSSVHVGDLTDRLEGAADRALARKNRGRRLERSLERAGIELRPAEFVVIVGAVALTVSLMVSLVAGILAAVIAFGATVAACRSWLTLKVRRRVGAFVEQLPATVQLMAGALRAGYALPQAAETVASESDAPTADEFHRLVTEHRLGRDFGDSLDAMDERIGAEDFSWIVQAIAIHRQVGGDLAEVLDNVNETMRDRSFIRRQFRAVSAEGRYSAYLIVSLPFVVTAVLFVTNPDYIGRLFEGTRGMLAILMALSLMTIGSLWMRALMKVRF